MQQETDPAEKLQPLAARSFAVSVLKKGSKNGRAGETPAPLRAFKAAASHSK
jgi:hypothetical protein